jgi:hypothetical protein
MLLYHMPPLAFLLIHLRAGIDYLVVWFDVLMDTPRLRWSHL